MLRGTIEKALLDRAIAFAAAVCPISAPAIRPSNSPFGLKISQEMP